MFMRLPDALSYIWQESGISALVVKKGHQVTTRAIPGGAENGVSAIDDLPDSDVSRPVSACTPQHSVLSAPTAFTSPSQRPRPGSPAQASSVAILASPTLQALHRNSKEFLADWTGEALFLEHFGELRLPSTGQPPPRNPSSLVSLATMAVMRLPQKQRVNCINMLASANPGLADLILSVNKCGYGPVAEFVQHLDLHSSDVSEDDNLDAQVQQGKVTLSTVHGCKGAAINPRAL